MPVPLLHVTEKTSSLHIARLVGRRIDFITEFAKMLQFVNQGPATDAENFRRLRPIETMIAQSLQDGLVLDVFQTLSVGRFNSGGWLLERAHPGGQVFRQNQFAP